tara:strand:+ start:271 stop:501 length:231 start_codon:yes stop_codon:yes gene_type:complete
MEIEPGIPIPARGKPPSPASKNYGVLKRTALAMKPGDSVYFEYGDSAIQFCRALNRSNMQSAFRRWYSGYRVWRVD